MAVRGSGTAAVLALRPFPAESYAAVDLNRLTVFAIDELNRLNLPTTLENIAIATFRMFPKRFAMVGYPDYPDVARVNRALLQLRPKYRNWAVGKTRLGWQLTQAGEDEAHALRKKLAEVDKTHPGANGAEFEPEAPSKVKRTMHPEDTTRRIRSLPLFAKYREGWHDVEPLEVFDVLEAYTHTPPDALRSRLQRLRATALSADDEEVAGFLDELAKRFSVFFARRS